MTTQEQYIERLREMVEAQFGRRITTLEECDALSVEVGEKTNTKLDSRAYATLFLSKSRTTPRPVTLSTLSRYIGFGSWGDFCSSTDVLPATDTDIIPITRRWGVIILTIVAILVVMGAAIFLIIGNSNNDEQYNNIVARVEQMWLMKTIEECNAIRTYNMDDNYYTKIDEFITNYNSTLTDDIASSIIDNAKQENITMSQEDIAHEAERITTMCNAMCECLYKEESGNE